VSGTLFGTRAARCPLESRIHEGSIPKSARIAVYENNFTEIVSGALRNVFPTIDRLVGDTCFRTLARTYAQTHASYSGDLQSWGSAFPALLDGIYSSTEHAFLGDVARLEFAIDECLIAGNLPGISSEQLQDAINADEAVVELTPNPSLHLIESDFPILDIWRAHRDGMPENASLDGEAQNVAVVRTDEDAQITLLSKTGARLIRALRERNSLDDAMSDLGATDTEQLAQALRDIVRSGAFSEIELT
jgi:hypothetical protein